MLRLRGNGEGGNGNASAMDENDSPAPGEAEQPAKHTISGGWEHVDFGEAGEVSVGERGELAALYLPPGELATLRLSRGVCPGCRAGSE